MRQEVTTIEGEEVLLRPLRESDLEESARAWTPELRHMYGGSPTAPAASLEDRRSGKQRWLERVQRGEEGHVFAIEVGGRYIGWAALYRFDEANRSAHWRGGIENSECWGRGYGTETMQLMLRYGFETLDLHRIGLRVAAYNARAIRCYEKCGFHLEGIERDSFLVDGEWHDDWLMAVLREGWCDLQTQRAAGGLVVRGYRTTDYDDAVALWREVGFHVDDRDSAEALARCLVLNPGLFLIAEAGGSPVGTVLGTWDGRRSIVYRLAVDPDWRRRGIATRLMAEMERKLKALGAKSVALLTWRDDQRAMAFYEALGYDIGEGVAFMMKRLDTAEGSDDGCGCD